MLGIVTRDTYQIVFLDTPGVLEPRYELQRRMLDQALGAVGDADVLVCMIEARAELRARELALLDDVAAARGERALVCVLNKIDKVEKHDLLPMIGRLSEVGGVAEIVPVSALKEDGVAQLEQVIASHLPQSPPFYPAEALSDQPERFFVAEIVREKIFLQYGDEIPFSTAVVIDGFDETRPKTRIRARVIVERDSQKGILIGKGGAALKSVGQAARLEIEAFLDRQVYLEIHVAVRKKWRADQRFLKELGL